MASFFTSMSKKGTQQKSDDDVTSREQDESPDLKLNVAREKIKHCKEIVQHHMGMVTDSLQDIASLLQLDLPIERNLKLPDFDGSVTKELKNMGESLKAQAVRCVWGWEGAIATAEVRRFIPSVEPRLCPYAATTTTRWRS